MTRSTHAWTRALTALCAVGALTAAVSASSHREAPGIAELPKLDSTDFYMFNSYEPGREGYVTIVACYQPFQTPYGGPNFFNMDPDAVYQIHIDNNADAQSNITFNFRFRTILRDVQLTIGDQQVSVPLYNVGAIGPNRSDVANQNIQEVYTVELARGNQQVGEGRFCRLAGSEAIVFRKPADNVGTKTIADYEPYARQHVYDITIPGATRTGRVFVGQRKDPFVVNLGEAFDLFNLDPLGSPTAKADVLKDDNVTAICIEVPAEYLRGRASTIIGGWTTASLPRSKVFRSENPTFRNPTFDTGNFVQVSRLGNPLVNELVIGLPDKNKFSASQPSGDGQFLTYVTNPTLPAILQTLFGVQAPCLPRTDLVSIFLTGVTGLNQPPNVTASEMLRLNTDTTAIPVVAKGLQNYLGVLGGDNQGFPNGRRPGDDVVDISLRAVMGAIIPNAGTPGSCAPDGNRAYTDGAKCDDSLFDAVFPYLRKPVNSSPNLGTP